MNIQIAPHQRLTYWLQSVEVDLGGVKLDTHHGERSLIANRSFDSAETVLHIPSEFILDSELAKKSEIGNQLIKDGEAELSDQAILAAYLLCEKENPNSMWRYYIDSLPTDFSHIPLFFDSVHLDLLQGSSALERTLERTANIHRDYHLMMNLSPLFKAFSIEDFTWARTAINSRCFTTKKGDQSLITMVPLADMCNHDSCANVSWSGDEQGFKLTARSPITAGEEIRISYGVKSHSRFFSSYGFLPENQSKDTAKINISLNTSDPHYDQQKQLLGGNSQFEFEVSDKWSTEIEDILTVLRIKSLAELSDTNIKKIQNLHIIDLETEHRVLASLKKAINFSLILYSTTIEEDEAFLDSNSPIPAEQNTSLRCRNVTHREKRVLRSLMAFCDEALPLLVSTTTDKSLDLKGTHTLIENYTTTSLGSYQELQRHQADSIDSQLDDNNKIERQTVKLTQVLPQTWMELHKIRLHADDRSAVPTVQSLLKDVTFGPANGQKLSSAIEAAAIWVDGKPKGIFTYVWLKPSTVWFGGFQVDRSIQGYGHGKTAMLKLLEMLIQKPEFTDIQLDVIRTNYKVMKFYQRLGFKLISLNIFDKQPKWVMQLPRTDAEKLLASEGYKIKKQYQCALTE